MVFGTIAGEGAWGDPPPITKSGFVCIVEENEPENKPPEETCWCVWMMGQNILQHGLGPAFDTLEECQANCECDDDLPPEDEEEGDEYDTTGVPPPSGIPCYQPACVNNFPTYEAPVKDIQKLTMYALVGAESSHIPDRKRDPVSITPAGTVGGISHGCLQIDQIYWNDAQWQYKARVGWATPNINYSDAERAVGPPNCPPGGFRGCGPKRSEGFAFVESWNTLCERYGGNYLRPGIAGSSDVNQNGCEVLKTDSWNNDCACTYSKWIAAQYFKKYADKYYYPYNGWGAVTQGKQCSPADTFPCGQRRKIWSGAEYFSPVTICRLHHLGPIALRGVEEACFKKWNDRNGTGVFPGAAALGGWGYVNSYDPGHIENCRKWFTGELTVAGLPPGTGTNAEFFANEV